MDFILSLGYLQPTEFTIASFWSSVW
jgi:hypothetical protein